jgi:hypothetical protein
MAGVDLEATARDYYSSGDLKTAILWFKRALGAAPERDDLWIDFSRASRAASRQGGQIDYDLQRQALSAAVLGYQASRTAVGRGQALGALAEALGSQQSGPTGTGGLQSRTGAGAEPPTAGAV